MEPVTFENQDIRLTTAGMKAASCNSDLKIMEKLRSYDTTVLDGFYIAHRIEFVKWANKSFSLTSDQALDIYQDAIIILYENVTQGKLTELQSSLKTYVFAIGKNMILKQFYKEKRLRQEWHQLNENAGMEDDVVEDDTVKELNRQQEAVIKCLDDLADGHRTILQAYYYQKLSMKDIAEKLGYKNEDVVKSLKVRILKTLKKAVSETLKNNN